MKDLFDNRFGKFNCNEQKYVAHALDSDHQNQQCFNENMKTYSEKNGCKL